MADTQNVVVTTTWTQFPAATEFIMQNTSTQSAIHIAIAAATPDSAIVGYVLDTGQSANRLGPGVHWHRVERGSVTVPFTITEV